MFKLNPNLREFWATRKPYKLLKGGRFSSKTQDAGGMAAFLARNYSLKFLCIRQFQARIADSVYTVIKEKIEQAGWRDEFDIGVSTIRHKITGSEFLFYGIARNIEEIKGTEGVDICWIEEGEGLTEEQWSIIDPTIRKEGSEIWILWNPRLQTDFVQAKLPKLLGDSCVVKHINYQDNPFLSDTARQKAERLKELDYDAYRHIYLGEPLTDDEMTIIKREWLRACIDAHVKLGIQPSGSRRIGFDVADAGEDACAMIEAHGSLACWSDQWKAKEDDLIKSTMRVWHRAREVNAEVIYDAIGVGAGVGSKLKELGDVRYQKFIAGGQVYRPDDKYNGVLNRDFFANIKSQAWWLIADRIRNTYSAITQGATFDESEMIFLDSSMVNLDELIDELATPFKDFDPAGRVKVESKKDLAKRDISSPNLADAFIMAFIPQIMATPRLSISNAALQQAYRR